MSLKVKWPFPAGPTNSFPLSWKLASIASIAFVGSVSKFWAVCMNKVTMHRKEILIDAIENRAEGRPLITVFNHHSCLDDPMLWGMLDFKHLVTQNQKYMRWALAAADISFTREPISKFFSRGRVCPVIRGGGVYQRSMDYMLEKLNEGAWVHTFPEGRINMQKEEFLRLKWGVGRLVAESNVTPIVIPMWHYGMDDILYNYPPYIPRIGQRATLYVGDPMDFTSLVQNLKDTNRSPKEMRKEITDRIQDEFLKLKEITENLYFNVDNPLKNNKKT